MLYGDMIGSQRSIGSTQMISGDRKKIIIQGSNEYERSTNTRQYFSPQHNGNNNNGSESLGFKN